MGSPTYRTLSTATTRYGGTKLEPSGRFRGTNEAKVPRPSRTASAPLNTEITPAAARASARSIFRSLAAACGERTTCKWAASGREISSVYLPPPRSSLASSVRGTARPSLNSLILPARNLYVFGTVPMSLERLGADGNYRRKYLQ